MRTTHRRVALALSFFALNPVAGCSCGSSDEAGSGNTPTTAAGAAGGTGTAGKAGAAGSTQAGQAGSTQAGQAGSTQAGQAGSTQAGQGGSTQGGQAGSTQAGQGGSTQAGQGGDAGAPQGGQAGSTQAGQGGSTQAGQGGSAQGGQAGSAQGGQAGSTQGGQAGSTQAGAGGACGKATGTISGALDPTGAGVGKGTNLGPFVIDAAATNRSDIADVAFASDGTAVVFGSFTGTVLLGSTTLGPATGNDLFVARMDVTTGTPVWIKTFTDTGGPQSVTPYRVRVDATDAVYLLADGFNGTNIDFGGGPIGSGDQQSVVLAKLDSSGAHVWSKSLGGASVDTGRALAVHPAGGITVAFGSAFKVNDLGTGQLLSYVLARYDDAGTLIWARGDGPKGGGTKTTLSGVGVDAAGNIVVGGGLHDNLDDGCGGYLTVAEPRGVWAKRYDPSGSVLWARVWKAAGGEAFANDLAVDAVGDTILVGTNTHQLDLGGGPLAGAGTSGSMFVGKIDAAGQHVWSHSFAGTPIAGRKVIVDPAGNAIVAGDCSGASYLDGNFLNGISCNLDDVFVMKWGPTGNHVWTQAFGDSVEQFAGGVAWKPGTVLFSGRAKAQSLDLGAGSFSTNFGGILYQKGFYVRLEQ